MVWGRKDVSAWELGCNGLQEKILWAFMNARQYWIPFFQQLKQLLRFVKTCCLPHTLFPSILKNDSFAAKIISGRELGEKMKLFTNSSSHTHQKPVKISSLSQEWFSRNNFPREIFAKITALHSSVPIPCCWCCCLSCSYKSILGKSKEGNLLRMNIISCHHWLYLSILNKLKEEYQHCCSLQ